MNEYVSRIPNISCMKSWIEGHGRAVLGSIANSARYRQNRLCSLARPSHALQCRISCKIYLESLKHPHSPCVGLVNHSYNFIYKILNVLTADLKWKNLSKKISRKFEPILSTRKHYWLIPDENWAHHCMDLDGAAIKISQNSNFREILIAVPSKSMQWWAQFSSGIDQ